MELLILAQDTISPGLLDFKKGHVISMLPDFSAWGNKECLNKFLVVRIDATAEDAQKYIDPVWATPITPEIAPDPIMTRIRRYRYDFTKLDMIKIQSQDWYVPVVTPADFIDEG